VTHLSRISTVVIDLPASDHDRGLAFWAAAAGQPLPPLAHSEYHGDSLHGQEFCLLIQSLGDGVPRVHLDIHTDNLDAEVARLERLGAQRVQRAHSWWVMRDPAGLLFCVIPAPAGELSEASAHRWE
jgi:hypothetical protein